MDGGGCLAGERCERRSRNISSRTQRRQDRSRAKELGIPNPGLGPLPSSEDASAASRAVAELELVIVTAEDDEYKGERLAEDRGRLATAGRNWKPLVVLAAANAAKRRAVMSFMVLSDEVKSMVPMYVRLTDRWRIFAIASPMRQKYVGLRD